MKYKFEDRSGIIWVIWLIGAIGLLVGIALYDRIKDTNSSPLNLLLMLFTIWMPLFLVFMSSLSLVNYYARIKGAKGDFLEIIDDRLILPNTDSIFIPFLKTTNEVRLSTIKSVEIDVIGMIGVSRLKISDGTQRNLVVTSKNLREANFKNLITYFKNNLSEKSIKGTLPN